jgi:hypothetical protein
VIRTAAGAPNCNAHAEQFVRSIEEEYLNRIVPLGERHLRSTLASSRRTITASEATRQYGMTGSPS